MVSKPHVFIVFFIGFLCSFTVCQSDDKWDRVPEILSRIKPPQIPNRICNIVEFGAVRSPNDDDVEAPSEVVDANIYAFANAIQYCHVLGGGTVLVPIGTYITSTITLKSNISLEVSTGAVIRFTRDETKYPIVFTRWEGIELMNYSPFIYAFEEENIAITGNGIVDGNCNCDNWWPWKGYWPDEEIGRMCWDVNNATDQANDRSALFQMAEDNIPVEERVFGEGHYLRPQFIQPYRSKNVLIEGITSRPNSDGVDPESFKDVWITGVTFNSGDDDIAIKSGRNTNGRRISKPSENIVIQNCTMADGHGSITLGSCISGGVRNIFAENCYLDSPYLNTAIRVKNNALRGGYLEGFYLRNIRVGQVRKQVIEVDFYYEEGPNAAFTPILKNVTIENMVVTGGAPYSLFTKGYCNHPNTSYIEITLRNVSFSGLTNNPNYVVENVDVVSTTWEAWDITNPKSDSDSNGSNSLSKVNSFCFGLTVIYMIILCTASFTQNIS